MCCRASIPLIVTCVTLAIVSAGTAEGQSCPQITDPQPLNANAETDGGVDRSPQVATDGQGLWIAVWYSGDDLGGTIGIDRDILVARSTDNGATWSDPAPLNTNAASDAGDDKEPQLTTDGAGRWVAVWGSNDDLGGSIDTDGDILVSISADNGATWSDPAPLNTNAAADEGLDSSPQVTTDRQGLWIAVWHSWDDLGGTIGTDGDILFALSADNGATWTNPAPLNTNATSDSGSDRFPQLATDTVGHWVTVWSSEDDLGGTIGTDTDILFALSTDGGGSWTPPAPLNTDASTDIGGDGRAQVTTDGAGHWVAVWNSAELPGTDLDILFARSTDDGTTWTDPAPLNANAQGDLFYNDLKPQVATDGLGVWVAVWEFAPHPFFDNDIVFSVSTDAGTTWGPPAPLNTNATSDPLFGFDWNPQLTTDGQGNWVGVWWSLGDLGGTIGPDPDILFARFELSPGDCPCPIDLDGDGEVGAGDLAQLLGAWGPNLWDPADLNGDGVVDAFDLATLLGNWGACP